MANLDAPLSSSGSARHPRERGFTLVELLTSIAIIAILGAILIAAVGSARQSAHGAAELSDVRQLAQATLLFAVENRSQLFREDQPWIEQMTPEYLLLDQDFFQSPFDERTTGERLSYGVNWNAVHLRLSQTDKPSYLYLFAPAISPEGEFEGTLDQDLYLLHTSPPPRGTANGGRAISVAFADGHAEAVPLEQFTSVSDNNNWFMCSGNECIFKPPPD